MSENRIRKIRSTSIFPHNGPDSAGFGFDVTRGTFGFNGDGTERYLPQEYVWSFRVAAADIDTDVLVAPVALKLTSIKSTVNVGASGASVQPVKCTGTTAIGSGTALTAATVNLNSTANTVVTNALHATAANYTFVAGDRLAFDYAGTLTGLSGTVTITARAV